MKKLLLPLLLLLSHGVVCAQQFESRNLIYEIISTDLQTCRVIGLANGVDYSTSHLTIPAVTSYIQRGFSGASVRTPYTVIEIAPNAFLNAPLSKVTYPITLQRIGASAFAGSSLSEIVASTDPNASHPEITEPQLDAIGSEAFYNTRLTSLYIPKNVTNYGVGATALCSGLTEFVLDPDNHNFIVDYQGLLYNADRTIVLDAPKRSQQYIRLSQHTEVIAQSAFAGCQMSDITFSPRLREIQESAFRSCVNLSDIRLPNSVNTIGSYCFAFSGVNSVVLGSDITEINDYTFSQCPNLHQVICLGDIHKIGMSAFSYCPRLVDIELPNITTKPEVGILQFTSSEIPLQIYVPENMVSKMLEIQSVNYYASVKATRTETLHDDDDVAYQFADQYHEDVILTNFSASAWAQWAHDNKSFYTNLRFKEDIFQHHVVGLADGALSEPQVNVRYYNFDNGFRYILGKPFSGSPVTCVNFPTTLQYVDDSFLVGATKLKNIYVTNRNSRFANPTLSDGTVLETMMIDKKDNVVLAVCPDPDQKDLIEVPDGMQVLANHAFHSCKVDQIVLPSTLQEVGEGCFDAIESTSIKLRAEVPPFAFADLGNASALSQVELCVPSQSVMLYRADPYWGQFNVQPLAEEFFTLSGITYRLDLNESTATIYSADASQVSGNVVIPDAVGIEGKDFPVVAIRDFAFRDCASLTQLTLPADLTTIGKGFVLGCRSLSAFHVGTNPRFRIDQYGGLVDIAQKALVAMPAALTIEQFIPEIDETTLVPYCMAYSGVQSVYFYNHDNKPYSIGDYAFLGSKQLTEVIFPDFNGYFDYVGEGALMQTAVRRLDISRCVSDIPVNFCRDCADLQYVHFYSTIQTIGDYAFNGCTKLQSLELHNFMSQNILMSPSAFSPEIAELSPTLYVYDDLLAEFAADDRWSLFDVKPMPRSVKVDGNDFRVVSMALSELTFQNMEQPNNMEYGTFTIPNRVESPLYPGVQFRVTKAASHCFVNNEWVTAVRIPEGITTLGQEMFYKTKVAAVYIGPDVRYIHGRVFANMEALHSIDVDPANPYYRNGVDKYGIAGGDESMLIDVRRNALVRVAPVRAGHSSWDEYDTDFFEVPAGIRSVDTQAFANCPFEQVNFPASLCEIGNEVLTDMPRLSYVYLPVNIAGLPRTSDNGKHVIDEYETGHYDFTVAIADPQAGLIPTCTVWDQCSSVLPVVNRNGMNFALENVNGYGRACMVRLDLDYSGDYVAPDIIYHNGDRYDIHNVRHGVFSSCEALTSVDLHSLIRETSPYMFDHATRLSKVIFRASDELHLTNKMFQGCWSLTDIYMPALKFFGTDNPSVFQQMTAGTVTLHTQILVDQLLAQSPTGNYLLHEAPGSHRIVTDAEQVFTQSLRFDPRPMYNDYGRTKSLNEVTVRVHGDMPVTRIRFYVEDATRLMADENCIDVISAWREQFDTGFDSPSPLFAFNPELEALGFTTNVERLITARGFMYRFDIMAKDYHNPVSLDGVKICDLLIGIDRQPDVLSINPTYDALNIYATDFRDETQLRQVIISNLLTPLEYKDVQIPMRAEINNAVALQMDVNTDGIIDVGDIISIQGHLQGKKTHFNPALAPFTNEKLPRAITEMQQIILNRKTIGRL